jgi:hypothetical protein
MASEDVDCRPSCLVPAGGTIQEKERLLANKPPVYDTGKVPLQASDRVPEELARLTFPVEVFACARVVADLGEGDGAWPCSADGSSG